MPPGFTIATEVCSYYYKNKHKYPVVLKSQVANAILEIEKISRKKFGDIHNPLLLSVCSGAGRSMPGRMDRVWDIGLNDQSIQELIKQSVVEPFAYVAYADYFYSNFQFQNTFI